MVSGLVSPFIYTNIVLILKLWYVYATTKTQRNIDYMILNGKGV